MRIKNKLKALRTELNFTQEELADGLGISRQSVIAIEKGRYSPSLKLAFRIANFFNCNIEDIFFYEE